MSSNTKSKDLKLIILSSIGGILEFYDFAIFIMLSKFLAEQFFTGAEYARLMGTYSVFAIGYLARPFGGFILSHLGDTLGRKSIFLLSIFAMTCATFLIGVIPCYSVIGLMAPVLLVLARIIQGLAIGGEIPGAITFVYEHMPNNKKLLGVSIIFAGIYSGVLLGSIISFLTGILFTNSEINQYAWRFPFIIGGIMGVIGFIMRRNMTETPAFLHLKDEKTLSQLPILDIIKSYKFSFSISFCLTLSFGTVMVFFYFLFPSYLMTTFKYEYLTVFRISSFNSLSVTIFLIIMGIASVKYGKKHTLLILSYIGITIFSFFTLYSLIKLNAAFLYLFLALLSVAAGMGNPIQYLTIAELFPTSVRYSGVAASYNIANAILGGSTPLVVTWLVHKVQTQFAPIYYFAVACCIGIIACILVPLCKKQIESKAFPRQNLYSDSHL